MQNDAGRQNEAFKDIARTLSGEFSQHSHLDQINTHVPYQAGLNAFAPPSPLYVSSDTESSIASTGPHLPNDANNGPACSAPKNMDYFRMSKGGPDSAWNEIQLQRQRRKSMQPFHHRPIEMTRQDTQSSQYTSFGEVSSDSLSSMWEREQERERNQELALGRSSSGSGSGRLRLAPLSPADERIALGMGQRSTSTASVQYRDRSGSSSGPAPIPTSRPLPRSNLSQTSLAASSYEPNLPPEFGSMPEHTLSLLQSYVNAFPNRVGPSSGSQTQRGFVFPPTSSLSTSSSNIHGMACRDSSSTPVSIGMTTTRPSGGTIRRKSKTRDGEYTSWDAFGKEECRERASRLQRAESSFSASSILGARGGLAVPTPEAQGSMHDTTPKQSLKMENGKWQVKHSASQVEGADRDHSSSSFSQSRTLRARSSSSGKSNTSSSTGSAEMDADGPSVKSAPVAPTRPHLASSASGSNASTAKGAITPRGEENLSKAVVDNKGMMPPPPTTSTAQRYRSRGGSTADLENALNNLRLGGGNLVSATSLVPVGDVHAQTCSGAANGPSKIPAQGRGGFNWDEYERQGGKVYSLPKALQAGGNKAGLFYFK